MSPTRKQASDLQVVEKIDKNRSVLTAKVVEPEAAHYSDEFRQRVVTYFAGCESMRRTARAYGLTIRVVNEILHLATLRKGPAREAAMGIVRTMRGAA